MNKHSIIPTPQIPGTVAVAADYSALEMALAEAISAWALVKEAKDGLLEGPPYVPSMPTDEQRRNMPSWEYVKARNTFEKKTQEREYRRITLYGCKLRFIGTLEVLIQSRIDLSKAVNALRVEVDDIDDSKLTRQAEAARCNIFFADQLLSRTNMYQRWFREATSRHTHEYLTGFREIDLSASLGAEYVRARREWVVMSRRQGSSFCFDGEDGSKVPDGPYWTFYEARDEANAWIFFSDTIGGGAQLYNVRTNETVTDF